MYMSPAAVQLAGHTSEIGRHNWNIYHTSAGFKSGAREGWNGSAGTARCVAISRRERLDTRSARSTGCFVQTDLQAAAKYRPHLERRLFWKSTSCLGTHPQ